MPHQVIDEERFLQKESADCGTEQKLAQASGRVENAPSSHRTIHSKTQLTLGSLFRSRFVFLAPIVLFLELFDATGSINKLLLAREERVRGRTDIDGHQRKCPAFVFDGLLRLD